MNACNFMHFLCTKINFGLKGLYCIIFYIDCIANKEKLTSRSDVCCLNSNPQFIVASVSIK